MTVLLFEFETALLTVILTPDIIIRILLEYINIIFNTACRWNNQPMIEQTTKINHEYFSGCGYTAIYYTISTIIHYHNWGEPEQAPHLSTVAAYRYYEKIAVLMYVCIRDTSSTGCTRARAYSLT